MNFLQKLTYERNKLLTKKRSKTNPMLPSSDLAVSYERPKIFLKKPASVSYEVLQCVSVDSASFVIYPEIKSYRGTISKLKDLPL